ncbi:MAG: glutathione S-transferase family protein [Terricaulis sp.]|nr:glutathione S-transferase family protein [Terricaulis sp.]
MTAPFRLYGAELSPYSVKVRSYLRFKGLEFQWLERSNARQEEFSRYAKLPLAPILVDAEENALQDSTPMIEAVEAQYAEPAIAPEDEALAFLAALLEDYADEWLNKAMFHYRWTYPEDQQSAAKRIVEMLFEGAEAPEGIEDAVRARMVGRLHHVGSSSESAPIIEGSFTRLIGFLEELLKGRAYLFGGRPSLADFGLAAQLKQLLSDPTPGAVLRAQAPGVVAWVERMDAPTVSGPFETLEALRAPLADLLKAEVAGAYLPWMAANADAVEADAQGVSLLIGAVPFAQKPQRYAAKALAELRRKRALVESEALAALLAETGCAAFLDRGAEPDEADAEDEGGEAEGAADQD